MVFSAIKKVALKIPTNMFDGYRLKKIHPSDVTEENVGAIILEQINRPMPLLIKNEPENP